MNHTPPKMPTFWILIVSTMLLTILTGFYRDTKYSSYTINIKKEPLLTILMQGLGDRVYFWDSYRQDNINQSLPYIIAAPASFMDPYIEPLSNNTEIAQQNTSPFEENTDSPIVSIDEPKTYSFDTVDISYFDDALFIGDSRTVGLYQYSTLTNASFYAKISATIYNILDDPMIKAQPSEFPQYGSQDISVRQALSAKQFGKIYIMIGINELGTGTADSFLNQYQKVIDIIKTLQPNAIIYIESIMHVTTDKSDNDPIYNNQNIDERNQKIMTIADYQDIFYLDINEALDDDSNGLNPEYTFDSVHLKASQYTLWEEYLFSHGILK